MLQLMKAETVQLRKNMRSFFLLFSVLGAIVTAYFQVILKWLSGFPALEVTGLDTLPTAIEMGRMFLESSGTVILVLLLVDFVFHHENSNRTMINLITTGHSRTTIYLEKWITMLLTGLIAYLLYWAILLPLYFLIYHPGHLMIDWNFIGGEILALMSYWGLYACLGTAFVFNQKNETLALVMAYLFAFLGGSLVNLVMSHLVPNLFTKIGPFLFFNLNPSNPIIWHHWNINWLLMILWGVVFLFIGWIFFKNRDVN
ncbi:MAG: hypothetical protein Q4A55_06915 [Aerococcus sp.]|nr:hypothetical protein [Aerococcus sp.]